MIKIMIVDDEKGICDYLGHFFQHRGHQVFGVSDPRKAMAILEKENPQIILLDIIMDHVNGLELLKQIRAVNKTAKIIMISVADEAKHRQKAMSLGADAFIKKPFTTEFLESVVMEKILELVKD